MTLFEEVLKLSWEKYLIAINTIFYTFWCKTDYCDIPIKKLQNADCHTYMISFKTILQRFGLSEIVIYAYFYGPIKK